MTNEKINFESEAKKSLQKSIDTQAQGSAMQVTLNKYLSTPSIRQRIEQLVGENAEHWISTIINVGTSSKELRACNPQTIVNSAIQSIALKLPIDKNLGFAYIIPYGGSAQFQLGYKGFIQLAMRSGQYKTINVTEIYEGQLKTNNILTGEIEFDNDSKTSDVIIGYAAYFRLLNGFEKTLYMTKAQIEKHAKTFSKTYNFSSSIWQKDFDSMAKKTVLKLLLSKYGILSVEMQKAMKVDQSVIKDAEGTEVEYCDNFEDVTEIK